LQTGVTPEQVVPHAPQLFASVWVSMQAPLGAVPQQVAVGASHAMPLPHRHSLLSQALPVGRHSSPGQQTPVTHDPLQQR
jgi:hypothetical protein